MSGDWGRQALDFVNEIGRRIAAVRHTPRSAAIFSHRISAVQRGNAFFVQQTFKSNCNV